MVIKQNMETFNIHTDCLFDSKKKRFMKNTSIKISAKTGLITDVYERGESLPATINGPHIDLRGKCVMPGFVDSHTHIFLHSYSETPSLNQMRDESSVERIVRATNHCRTALLAGYTTYRDLGTESLGAADVHVRNAINRGIIPGPRIYCATEALASSGGYEIRQENEIGGTTVPRISDPCDGPVGCRAAVRRRLAAGADVIKFYATYRNRTLRFPPSAWPGLPDILFPPKETSVFNKRNPNFTLFQQDEMNAIVAEANFARTPVAAHASTVEAITMAAKAGVTTIEHGQEAFGDKTVIKTLLEHKTIYVPTLAVFEADADADTFEAILKNTKAAFDAGVRLAAGGDTGAFAHGDNAREMELLVRAGIPLEDVLVAATLHGWEACGGDWCGRKFGCIEPGCAADFVALATDPRDDTGALRKVEFVMKDARVWKKDGQAVGMW